MQYRLKVAENLRISVTIVIYAVTIISSVKYVNLRKFQWIEKNQIQITWCTILLTSKFRFTKKGKLYS